MAQGLPKAGEGTEYIDVCISLNIGYNCININSNNSIHSPMIVIWMGMCNSFPQNKTP